MRSYHLYRMKADILRIYSIIKASPLPSTSSSPFLTNHRSDYVLQACRSRCFLRLSGPISDATVVRQKTVQIATPSRSYTPSAPRKRPRHAGQLPVEDICRMGQDMG